MAFFLYMDKPSLFEDGELYGFNCFIKPLDGGDIFQFNTIA